MSEQNTGYRPISLGNTIIPGNVWLAPMAGFTDPPFRAICASYGAEVTVSEMISSEGLIRDNKKTYRLTRRSSQEKGFGIQIFTNKPDRAAESVHLLIPEKPDFIDLNCGCPVPKVIQTGCGSALMKKPELVHDIVKAMAEASSIPVTVKIRSGWDAGSITYREVADAAVQAGAAAVAFHSRTRAQGYSGKADWNLLADLASRLPVPVIGSGDIMTPEDAARMLSETGCAGIMIARGSLGNPFIFRETRELLETGSYTPPSIGDRIKLSFDHLNLMVQEKGESLACREMRKHFCSYSKGLPDSASLRNRLVHAETVHDYRSILGAYLSEFAPGENLSVVNG